MQVNSPIPQLDLHTQTKASKTMSTDKQLIKQKSIAFAIHFTLSFAVIMIMALVVKMLWYPDFLFEIDGGIQGLQIVFWVDVVLGPVLVFSVYKKGKKGLFLDLILIFSAQIACLCWGVYQTYQERPLLLVLVEDTFRTMSASALDFHDIPQEAITDLPGNYPKRVYVTQQDSEHLTATEKLQHYLQDGPLYAQYKNYHPLSGGSEYIEKHGTSTRFKGLEPSEQKVTTPENKNGDETTAGLFFLFEGKFKQGIVEVDPKTGKFLSFGLL